MILIVDDEPSVLAYMSLCLRRLGFTPIEAFNALDAVEKLQTSGPFKVLITDISMPGHNGLFLAEQARKQNLDLPILFVSGHVLDLPGISDWLEQSKVRFLKKPFTPEALQREVERLIA